MISLRQYGYTEKEEPSTGLIAGRVIECQREQYTVMTERGQTAAVLKGSFHHKVETREDYPCVGDFVFLQYNENGVSLISQVLPRQTKFSRANFSGHAAEYVKTVLEQVAAANFDYVFILSSLNNDFNVARIMRYLTQARGSGSQPVVVLTKADLVADYEAMENEVSRAMPGVPVHVVSSYTKYGMDGLTKFLQPGKTIVFLGMSGVGKSSLLNTLMQKDVMAVREIREDDSRGRHTTTHRQLFMLPSGAMVIDTPGMRELGLFDAEESISAEFSDIEELIAECRFSDCHHQSEPGCAILAALASKVLSRIRWESYLAQRQENAFVDNRTGYLTEKRARHKRIANQIKQMKNGGYSK